MGFWYNMIPRTVFQIQHHIWKNKFKIEFKKVTRDMEVIVETPTCYLRENQVILDLASFRKAPQTHLRI